MTDTMKAATPWHLWAVGVISLLWNGYGGYDFVMSVTQGETYWRASGMNDAMVAYYNAMPTWMYVPWVAGVWGAVAGSVLLLLRNKLAVPAFALSLLGAVGSLVYGLANPMPPLPEAMAVMAYMPWVIAAIAAVLAGYAWSVSKKGMLS
jgi:hypothetical protein